MALTVVYSNAFGGVVAENRGGTVSTYVRDTLGSTIGLMDSAGTLTDRWEYWPYGEVASRSGTNVTPFTFLGVIGYFQDVLSKLFYVRARHLRVDLARWLTVDPLWPSEPAYTYASAGPAWTSDPTGLYSPCCPKVAGFQVCLNCVITAQNTYADCKAYALFTAGVALAVCLFACGLANKGIG